MKSPLVFTTIATAIFFLTIAGGCVHEQPIAATAATPAVAAPPVPAAVATVATVQTSERIPDPVYDQRFADAAEICYRNTPVISDRVTHMAFVTCMQDTPDPKGACALGYKFNVLKYTNDDETTVGYRRETDMTHMARDAFYKNQTYDAASLRYVPCAK